MALLDCLRLIEEKAVESTAFNASSPLKTKDRQFDNFAITGGTVICHYNNLRCNQWRQSYQIDDILFWVWQFRWSSTGQLFPSQWRHIERDGVSNRQLHDCLLWRLFKWRSKKASKLRIIGLCEGNSPVTGEYPAQRASNAENVSIWRRHHAFQCIHWAGGIYMVPMVASYRNAFRITGPLWGETIGHQ